MPSILSILSCSFFISSLASNNFWVFSLISASPLVNVCCETSSCSLALAKSDFPFILPFSRSFSPFSSSAFAFSNCFWPSCNLASPYLRAANCSSYCFLPCWYLVTKGIIVEVLSSIFSILWSESIPWARSDCLVLSSKIFDSFNFSFPAFKVFFCLSSSSCAFAISFFPYKILNSPALISSS